MTSYGIEDRRSPMPRENKQRDVWQDRGERNTADRVAGRGARCSFRRCLEDERRSITPAVYIRAVAHFRRLQSALVPQIKPVMPLYSSSRVVPAPHPLQPHRPAAGLTWPSRSAGQRSAAEKGNAGKDPSAARTKRARTPARYNVTLSRGFR